MELPFLDRVDELRRLARALRGPEATLVVVYGRRRCGKSTLLQKIVGRQDVYFLADERERPLQIQSLAEAADGVIHGFSAARYPSWAAVLETLAARSGGGLRLFLDEFPYLVKTSPELPSLIQREIDKPGAKTLSWVLCGSSQRMMQGLVLDRTAPLFGRAREVIQVRPLGAGWIGEALRRDPVGAVQAYSVWGGVPRYWELAAEFQTTRDAVRELVLDRNGVLHGEPFRLLLEDMRSPVQAYSILSLVGSGCHRLSEIAARMEKPAGSLTRPLANLIELGLIRRDTPWGEDAKATKRTLYRLRDPLLQFHTRFVQPHQAILELGRTDAVLQRFDRDFEQHVAWAWEELARESVPWSRLGGIEWGPASRWWGAGTDGRSLEIDLVAESLDGQSLLIGEAKWSQDVRNVAQLSRELDERIARFPRSRYKRVVRGLWLRAGSARDVNVLRPREVLGWLRR